MPDPKREALRLADDLLAKDGYEVFHPVRAVIRAALAFPIVESEQWSLPWPDIKAACIALADGFVPKDKRAGAHTMGLSKLVAHAVAHHDWHHEQDAPSQPAEPVAEPLPHAADCETLYGGDCDCDPVETVAWVFRHESGNECEVWTRAEIEGNSITGLLALADKNCGAPHSIHPLGVIPDAGE